MNARTTQLVLACLVLVGGLLLSAAIGQEIVGDPLPLKRHWIEPEDLKQRTQGRGVLIQMPLADFDSLVDQARQAQRIGKALPSLAVSTYKADLIGDSLSGNGTWVVHSQKRKGEGEKGRRGEGEKTEGAEGRPLSPSPLLPFSPTVLPLPVLNLALNNVKNKTLGGDAILGLSDGKNLGLVLEKAGSQTITFDWSLRGTTTPTGLHFDLKLPSCPQASIELKLPADHVVLLPSPAGEWRKPGVILSGPRETDDPQKRLWQLDLTGKNEFELNIRPLTGSSDTPTTQLVQIVTRQEIASDKVKADFEFQVDVPLHPVSELVFDCDRTLSPYEVSLASAEILNWKLEDPPLGVSRNASKLTIQLREPFQGTLTGLRIRCLGSRPAGAPWISPSLRLRQAVTRGETLKIHVHPDVPLERWDSGSFRLVDTSTGADGSMTLTLEGKEEAPSSLRRPSFLGKTQPVQLHTRQQTWWHLGIQGMTLNSDITFDVARGRLYQLVVKLPESTPAAVSRKYPGKPSVKNGIARDWRVEKVDVEPPELLQNWSIVGQEVVIDLTNGLNSRNQAKVSLRLNSPWEGTAGPIGTLNFPIVEVPLATAREGTLHIGVDPIFQASVVQDSEQQRKLPYVPFTSSPSDGPWGTPPLFSFPFRDQTVLGSLRLVPSSARLQVASRTQVTLLPESAVVATRLDIDPILGRLDHCDFIVAGASGTAWQARLERPGTRTVRLQRLGVQERLPYLLGLAVPGDALLGLSQPMLEKSVENLQIWRMVFSPPLTQRETVVLENVERGAWREEHGGPTLHAAVPALADTPRRPGEVLVQASGVSIGQVQVHGLVEQTKTGARSSGLRRYDEVTPLVPMLTIQAAPAAMAPAVQKYIVWAHLSSRVSEDGRVFHHLSLETASWHDKDIAIVLPDASSKVLGAKVTPLPTRNASEDDPERKQRTAGITLDDVQVSQNDKGLEVRIPVPQGGPRRVIDLYYSGEASWSGWPSWAHFDVSWPILPVAPLSRHRSWHLAPGLEPLRQSQWTKANVPACLEPTSLDGVRKAWHAGEPLLTSWLPWTKEDNHQMLLLSAREITLRRALPKEFTLGEALERLIFDHAAEPLLVVVDAAGLKTVGLAPDTPIGSKGGKADRPFLGESGTGDGSLFVGGGADIGPAIAGLAGPVRDAARSGSGCIPGPRGRARSQGAVPECILLGAAR